MKHIYNNKIFRDRRRESRSNQTKTEKVLWRYLGNSKLGLRFFRQYGVGGYILDFYCSKARLAIELDGETHIPEEQKLYDIERTKYLNGNNINVLRFWNTEMTNDIDKVIAKIIKTAKGERICVIHRLLSILTGLTS